MPVEFSRCYVLINKLRSLSASLLILASVNAVSGQTRPHRIHLLSQTLKNSVHAFLIGNCSKGGSQKSFKHLSPPQRGSEPFCLDPIVATQMDFNCTFRISRVGYSIGGWDVKLPH
ncbi:hypothetical protein RRG08_020646 [Elysia crispata]|uniref:Secreted protein n=1 Tax=Elysia crispata TaxID=231223 RepID=A0AAE1E856_9GAST|nr:hypothetical protein RRG08_020646 [Elysia crispata]